MSENFIENGFATNQTLWHTHRICQAFVLPRANFKGGVLISAKHARGVFSTTCCKDRALRFDGEHSAQIEPKVQVTVRPTSCGLRKEGPLKHASGIGDVKLKHVTSRFNVHAK
jgi:hypothetical protein